MLGFFILLIVMMGLWVYMIGFADIEKIRKNWNQYRCVPFMMPFASFFGYDTTENFYFCLDGLMKGTVGPILGPIFQILGTFLRSLSVIVGVVNNIRLMIATFVGGINVIFQNFVDRFLQLSDNFKRMVQRVRLLFGRLSATFFSIIYLAMSAQTALMNFGDTVLFGFLDTFCFDPDTIVDIEGKGSIPIRDAVLGDRFAGTGDSITSVFQFSADGQPMVQLPGNITVSSNHYVQYGTRFVRADDHPDAVPAGDWNGGKERPLICFNTNTHRIPVGRYTFLDYDETEEGDKETMKWVSERINAHSKESEGISYTTVFSPETMIQMKSGVSVPAKVLQLGMHVSQGKIVGIVRKLVSEYCQTDTQELVSPGLLVWNRKLEEWCRAGELYPVQKTGRPVVFMNFFIQSSATVQTRNDLFMRDYMEVHSPEGEQFYAKAIVSASCH